MNWLDSPIYVFDTETTSSDPSKARVVQLSILRFRAGAKWTEMKAWTMLANPGMPIPMDAQMIHGITDAMVKDKPRLEDRMKKVLRIFDEGKIFMAYNAPYDVQVLECALSRAFLGRKLPFRVEQVVDPLVFSRALNADAKGHKLSQVAARLGVPSRGAHDALVDCMNTAEVMVRLHAVYSLTADLDGLLLLQAKYKEEWEKNKRSRRWRR